MSTMLSSMAFALAVALAALPRASAESGKATELVNATDGTTSKLWQELQARYAERQGKNAKALPVRNAPGDYLDQFKLVTSGELAADVFTLSVGADLAPLARAGLIQNGWEHNLPHRSVIYRSPIVFLVPRGNPSKIKDWTDLASPGVRVLSYDPRFSRSGRYSFLGAWGSVTQRGGTAAEASSFVKSLLGNAEIRPFPTKAVYTAPDFKPLFAEKPGDVYPSWEKNALEAAHKSEGKLEVIYPPITILGEARLAILDKNVDQRKTREDVETFARFLFSDEAQQIIAAHRFRPVRQVKQDVLPRLEFFYLEDIFRDAHQGESSVFGKGGLLEQARSANR